MSRGYSFCTFLTVLFVILQLCGVIEWSWWLVFSPLWLPIALSIAVIVSCIILHIFFGER